MTKGLFLPMMRNHHTSLPTVFALIVTWNVATWCDDKVSFARTIKPILSQHCLACHGFDDKARQADLRLDLFESATKQTDGKSAIVPHKPDASELIRRVTSTDAEQVMPPPKHGKLKPEEIAALRSWIEQGAAYESHWAFAPPTKVKLPIAVADAHAPARVIDHFVALKLKQLGMTANQPADHHTLARRLYLDLLGLPPSSAELGSAVALLEQNKAEALVDQLLASPHFGERLAIDWLDAARYADTNGYSIDGGRHQTPWRDWVIQSFNDNLPYSQFIVQQIAGDMLPNRNDAMLVATGFQRNNMVTHEGGTIAEENLTNYNADRVKTLGEAVLGLTLGCAQCHNHKYDPITQRDYYRLFAYFNSLDDRGHDGDGGNNSAPIARVKTPIRTNELPALDARILAIKQKLTTPDKDVLERWVAQQRELEASRGKNFAKVPIKVDKVSTPNHATFKVEPPNRVRMGKAYGLAAIDCRCELPADAPPVTGIRVTFHPLDELPGKGIGNGDPAALVAKRHPNLVRELFASPTPKPVVEPASATNKSAKTKLARKKNAPLPAGVVGTFAVSAVTVTADVAPADQVNLYRVQPIKQLTASSEHPDYPVTDVLANRQHYGWAPAGDSNQQAAELNITFDKPINASQTPHLVVQLAFGLGDHLMPGLLSIDGFTGVDERSHWSDDDRQLLATPLADLKPEQYQSLWQRCAEQSDEFSDLRIELETLTQRRRYLTEPLPAMVMNNSAKPRTTRILNRGDYAQPLEVVSPGTIESLPKLSRPANTRLELADWLTMPDHPLTARVAVNRFWQLLFGTGIVATSADFGLQGEMPTHPELLDWLAVDFVEHGWDVKRLIKQIVLSKTYQQASAPSAEQLRKDPDNRYLARGPRNRLSAELVRDAALKTSGLLVNRLGGPSVHPYLPGDLWREVSHYGSTPATAQSFRQDHGENLYRRSLYTYVKRTAPAPNMTAFDATNREVCSAKRSTTNTPMQALVLLNDIQFVEASRAFAERIIKSSADDDDRIKWAVLECLSRPANAKELSLLKRTLTRERDRFQQDLAAARDVLSVGESKRDQAIPPSEHAAWMQVALLIMNLSEAVTKR